MKQTITIQIQVPSGDRCYYYDKLVDCVFRGNNYCALYNKCSKFDNYEKLDECKNGAPIDAVWIPK